MESIILSVLSFLIFTTISPALACNDHLVFHRIKDGLLNGLTETQQEERGVAALKEQCQFGKLRDHVVQIWSNRELTSVAICQLEEDSKSYLIKSEKQRVPGGISGVDLEKEEKIGLKNQCQEGTVGKYVLQVWENTHLHSIGICYPN